MGSHWASSTVRPALCGSRWTQVHGPWTVGRSTVDRVHPLSLLAWLTCTKSKRVRSARGGLCFHPRCAPASDMLASVILRWRWHPIKVGESFPRPWRTRWWCLGGGQGSLGHWPRRSVAWSWRCSPAGQLGAVPRVLVPRSLSYGQRATGTSDDGDQKTWRSPRTVMLHGGAPAEVRCSWPGCCDRLTGSRATRLPSGCPGGAKVVS